MNLGNVERMKLPKFQNGNKIIQTEMRVQYRKYCATTLNMGLCSRINVLTQKFLSISNCCKSTEISLTIVSFPPNLLDVVSLAVIGHCNDCDVVIL